MAETLVRAKPGPRPSRSFDFQTSQGFEVTKRMPAGTPPTLARLGMLVMGEAGGNGAGVIVGMTAAHCVVQYGNRKRGLLKWGEVCLNHVQPDPAQLAG